MPMVLEGKPAALGYRMPAEWEPHIQTWMGWPERPDNWREEAAPGQHTFVEVARAISEFEPVTICATAAQYVKAHSLLQGMPNIRLVEISMNDAWFRDTGPTFVILDRKSSSGNLDYQVAGIDWTFNSWGGGCSPRCEGNLPRRWEYTLHNSATASCSKLDVKKRDEASKQGRNAVELIYNK